MSYRSDLKIHPETGQIVSAGTIGNQSKPLPEIDAPAILKSTSYSQAWRAEAGDTFDLALEGLAGAHESIAKTFQGLVDSRDNPDPNVTQSFHLEKLERAFDASQKSLATKLDRARESAKARREAIDFEFRRSVSWDTKDSSELRQVLRSSEPERRAEIISEAIANGDGQVLGAVLGAHPTLSGLTAEHQRAYRQQALAKHRPDLAKLESALTKAEAGAFQGFHSFLEQRDTVTASKLRAEYAAQRKAAEEAAAKLKAATPNLY